jgi:putative transposase
MRIGSRILMPSWRCRTRSAALEMVQIDHTLVDVMVVDAIHRLSMGRSWITVAFDIATRTVLGGSVAMDC